MSSRHSVPDSAADLESDDSAVFGTVWRRYFDRLVEYTRGRMRGRNRAMADEEDIALSAFDSFYEGVREGRFQHLGDRDSFWRLLMVIAARKASNQMRRQNAIKRGGGNVYTEVDLPGAEDEDATPPLHRVAAPQPTPECSATIADQMRQLLHGLDDESLRLVAVRKFEGHTNEEISLELGCAIRTVERKVRKIRTIWGEEARQR